MVCVPSVSAIAVWRVPRARQDQIGTAAWNYRRARGASHAAARHKWLWDRRRVQRPVQQRLSPRYFRRTPVLATDRLHLRERPVKPARALTRGLLLPLAAAKSVNGPRMVAVHSF